MKTRKLFENFYIDSDVPLDARTVITNLIGLPVELPIYHRYLGMILFNKDDKKYYCFKNNTFTPELLFADINSSNVFGITVTDYADLQTTLNLYNTLGKTIFVAGLNVFFKFDGTQWKYFAGIYTFNTTVEFNNFPISLKEQGASVNYLNTMMKFDASLDLVKYITRTNTLSNFSEFEQDTNDINFNRYYIHRNQLYTAFDGEIYKIGGKVQQIKNYNIIVGKNMLGSISVQSIGDNNIPPYIKAILWINNNVELDNFTTELKPIELALSFWKNESNQTWQFYTYSDVALTGELEIQY